MKKGLLFFLLIWGGILISCNIVMATEITAPIVITEPGYYVLTNDITNFSAGDCIYIKGSHIVLEGNGHSLSGTGGSTGSGVMINFYNSNTDVTVRNIKISHFAHGIHIDGVATPTQKRELKIENCNLLYNGFGLHFNGINDLIINNSIIQNNYNTGIVCNEYGSDESVVISNNTIDHNWHFGISLVDTIIPSGNHTIENNVISGSEIGIYIGNHFDNLIQNNRIINNNLGVLFGPTSGNTIINNQFYNPANIEGINGVNTWSIPSILTGENIIGGPYLGGNAWFQPDGKGFSQLISDSDDDGICDSPYTIGPGNMDNYPLHTPSGSHSINLAKGWNFISVPTFLQPGSDTAMIFKDVNTSGRSIWQYNEALRKWEPLTQSSPVKTLFGYWIYSATDTSVPLQVNNNPNIIPSRGLMKGWNCIGYYGMSPRSAYETLKSTEKSWTTIIGFDSANQKYENSIFNSEPSSSSILNPNKGYWLYMTGDGQLDGI